MKKQLYIVYETDAWHTVSNRTPMGIFSSKTMAINSIVKFHNIPLEEIISNNDLQELTSKEIHKKLGSCFVKSWSLFYRHKVIP